MGVQSQNWFMDIVRQIFGFFDELVYGLFEPVLYGIFDMSGIITNSSLFTGIYKRLYVILGVFMAFKLMFSFFQYLVNPDDMTDKSKGVGKLFMNVFIMLFALLLLPSLLFSGFTKSSDGTPTSGGILPRAQKSLLPVLPKVIMGYDNIGNTDDLVATTTKSITATTLRVFFHPAEGLDDACKTGTYASLKEIENTDDFRAKIIDSCTVVKGENQRKFLWIFNVAKVYTYSYLPIISTAVGVLLLLIFLAISIDLAKRCFKLVVLEVIAPIPIMSLIDPKASKGESAFSKWLKNLTSVFLDIFIKVGLIYLILVFLQIITDTVSDKENFLIGLPTDNTRKYYLIILLIIGLVYFAKEAPKFIKDSLGMKADKGGMFDDVKSLAKTAGIVGGVGAGAVAGAVRSGAGNLSAAGAALANGHKGAALAALLNPGSAIKGAIQGGAAGKKGAGKNGNILGGLAAGFKSQKDGNAKRVSYAQEGSTAVGRGASTLRHFATGRSGGEWDEKRINDNKAVQDEAKSFDEFLGKKAGNYQFTTKMDGSALSASEQYTWTDLQKAVETNDSGWAVTHGFANIGEAAASMKKRGEEAKNSAFERLSGRSGYTKDDLEQAVRSGTVPTSLAAYGISSVADAQKELDTMNAFGQRKTSYDNACKEAKMDAVDHFSDIDSRKTQAENNTYEIRNRPSYGRRKANSPGNKKK